MSSAGLSLEQAPPISVPFRFFYTAPMFVALAALTMLAAGPGGLASRWTPMLLAATHLVTLGFMAMVMVGALFQMLPVVAGAVIPRPRLTAWAVHLPLVAGTLCLVGGFLSHRAVAFQLAAVLLGFAFTLFLGVSFYSLARAPARNATVIAIYLALVALALAGGLGITLAVTFSAEAQPSVPSLTNLHLLWGLLGWIGLLLVGIAYQVVPMFQLTPVYPPFVSRWLAPLVLILLLGYTAATLWGAGVWATLARAGLALAFAVFGAVTLNLQRGRKRRLPDVTLQFWRLAMASLLAAAALWGVGQVIPALHLAGYFPLWLGILYVVGFGLSVINGMLYKIVPFLVWFHLQSRVGSGSVLPNMKQIIPERRAWLQLRVHEAALGLLLGCVVWSPLLYPAGLALGFSSLLLWANLQSGWRCYRAAAADC